MTLGSSFGDDSGTAGDLCLKEEGVLSKMQEAYGSGEGINKVLKPSTGRKGASVPPEEQKEIGWSDFNK